MILKYGGDIVKFAGDAMVVTWIVDDGSEITNAARKFMQCAFSIQEELDAAEVAPGVKFSIKLGGGCGKSTLLFVGGKFGRLEYLMVSSCAADHGSSFTASIVLIEIRITLCDGVYYL